MSLELVGGSAAWSAHVLWYLARPLRRRAVGLRQPLSPGIEATLRVLAILLTAVSIAVWTAAHGAALGWCCATAAVTAAGSVNAIVAPLAPRAFLGGSAIAAVILFCATVALFDAR